MSKFGPTSAFLVVGGCDLTDQTNALTETPESLLEELHTFGDPMEEHLPIGIGKAALEVDGGVYDDAVGKMITAFQEMGETQQLSCYGMEGDAIGDPVVMSAGSFAAKWKRIAARDGLTKAGAEFTISGALLRGRILHGIDNESGDGDTLAVSAPKGGVDRALDGAPTPVVIVSSSVANPTVITTLTDHGLITGDVVVIAGHTGSTPGINGDRVITKTGDKTFTIPVNVSIAGAGGTVQQMTRKGAVAITSSSIANPTVITCAAAHGLITGDVVIIANHAGSVPNINGEYSVTVTTTTQFTIAVNVTTGGTGGTLVKVTSTDSKCHLHVPELTLGGYTDCIVTVLDSEDDDTYAPLVAFTAVTAVNASEAKTASGEVQRYAAVQWVFSGAGSDPTITHLVAIAR